MLKLVLPLCALIVCTAAGIADKLRRRNRAKTIAAFLLVAQEISFRLQTDCPDTFEILRCCTDSKAGKSLHCLTETMVLLQAGEDLYTVWEERAALFCQKQHLTASEQAAAIQVIYLLGSMEKELLCHAYAGLIQRLQVYKEAAEQSDKTAGAASVKIGLLCGIGLGLLFWQP